MLLLIFFMFGVTFGAVSVLDESSYKLDKQEAISQYQKADLDECKADLKECKGVRHNE